MPDWKTAFPEAPSAIVFPISHAGYAFVDDSMFAFHPRHLFHPNAAT